MPGGGHLCECTGLSVKSSQTFTSPSASLQAARGLVDMAQHACSTSKVKRLVGCPTPSTASRDQGDSRLLAPQHGELSARLLGREQASLPFCESDEFELMHRKVSERDTGASKWREHQQS